MILPDAAWERIAAHFPSRPLVNEEVSRDAALGRVLATPLTATCDQPPADVSAMDGFACAEVPIDTPLPVVGYAAAGAPLRDPVPPGAVARIATGGVVPGGTDRVVPVEASEETDDGRVILRLLGPEGSHVRRRGEVVGLGETALPAGAVLGPAALSLAAAHGLERLRVHRRPTVAILTTGDELVPPGEEPGPGQIRDTNSTFLLAACRQQGIDGRFLGIAGDRSEELEARLREGLEADVLLVCGGVSAGDRDLVEPALAALGCTTLFDAVAMQPGKPLVVARHDGGWVVGLPGNPASVMVGFWLFVLPLLAVLEGREGHFWQGAVVAATATDLPIAAARDRFLPASLDQRHGRLVATVIAPRGSHDVVAYARAEALLRVPAHQPPLVAGEPCSVLPLPTPSAGVGAGRLP